MGNLGRIMKRINKNKLKTCNQCGKNYRVIDPCTRNLGLACKVLGGEIDPNGWK